MFRTIGIAILTLSTALFAQEMSLQDCLNRALKNNLDIQIQALDTQMSGENVRSSMGIFDPVLSARYSEDSNTSPSVWELQGAQVFKSEGKDGSFSISQLIPSGGSVSLSYQANRSENNSTFYTVNPSFTGSLSLGFSQSLLQGFGTDVTRYRITLNEQAHSTSREQLRYQIMSTILAVEKAYWDLHYALADLEVKKVDLELARELLEDTQKRIDLGTQAPIDIYQAQVGVATREEQIILAQNTVAAAQDHLKNLLNVTDPKEWDQEIIPIEEVETSDLEFDLNESYEEALTLRPDVRIKHLDFEAKKNDYLVARNNLLPSLDLNVNYWYAGSGGDTIIRDPNSGEVLEIIPGGLSDANEQVLDRDYGNWTAALTFSMPIGNRDARAKRTIAELTLDRADKEMEQLRQAVFLEIRNALRNLATARQSMEAARVSRVLAEKNLDAERKKYDNGMTTSFQVLEVEADLSDAKTREIMARINVRKAIADFHFSVGNLADYENLDIVESNAPQYGQPQKRIPVFSYGWWIRNDSRLSAP
ncbi:MAG TPA: TolC family protein [Thermoanaerobaculia bacterium]|nr:TolC family protein [Thermoanaerobaculia bacterium]HUM29504.1 TolC family protein [Thermoanaerobaculia bacterium]HXK67887.1 TolC family protein [Thermoanaerobaculia bacterium]